LDGIIPSEKCTRVLELRSIYVLLGNKTEQSEIALLSTDALRKYLSQVPVCWCKPSPAISFGGMKVMHIFFCKEQCAHWGALVRLLLRAWYHTYFSYQVIDSNHPLKPFNLSIDKAYGNLLYINYLRLYQISNSRYKPVTITTEKKGFIMFYLFS
jgi:hypothetical protein